MTLLADTAERLCESHPDAAGHLQSQATDLTEAWHGLLRGTQDRRDSLDEARKFYTFLTKAR